MDRRVERLNSNGWYTSGAHVVIVGKAKLTSWAICTKDSNKIHRYKKSSLERRGGIGKEVECKKGKPTGGGVRVDGSPKNYILGTSTPFGITQRDEASRGLEPGWSSRVEAIGNCEADDDGRDLRRGRRPQVPGRLLYF